MSHQTYLIVCAILIGLPFVVSCIKGNPGIGLITGFTAFVTMGFVAGQGGSTLLILVVGFVIAGIGISLSLHRE